MITFWKRPYEEFVDFSFDLNTGEGKVRLIEKGNGAGSNLVHALSGQPLSVVTPEGKTIQIDIGKVMPPKGQKVAPEDVEKIRRWIDHGAPKERPK